MPTYEYACRVCGHTFDIVQAMSDEGLTTCPQCGGELRKVFAPPAISFKGSGFYATDHGKKSKEPSETSTDKTAPKGETTSDAGDTRRTGDKGGKGDKKEPAKPPEKKAPSSSGAGSGAKADP